MPSSWAERKTRMAISPRLATSSLRISDITPPGQNSGTRPSDARKRSRKPRSWPKDTIARPPVPSNRSAPRIGASVLFFALDRILQRPDPGDRRPDHVARLEIGARRGTDARGGAGRDDIARLQGDE